MDCKELTNWIEKFSSKKNLIFSPSLDAASQAMALKSEMESVFDGLNLPNRIRYREKLAAAKGYSYIGPFVENGLARAETRDGKFCYVDKTGQKIIQKELGTSIEAIGPFVDGLALIKLYNNNCYFIDKKGEKVLPVEKNAMYWNAYSFENGRAFVDYPPWAFVDTSGQIIKGTEQEDITLIQSDSVFLGDIFEVNYQSDEDGQPSLIDRDFDHSINWNHLYEDVESFSEGMGIKKILIPDALQKKFNIPEYQTLGYIFIDRDGKQKLPKSHESEINFYLSVLRPFEEGIAKIVDLDHKTKYIDHEGNEVFKRN